MDLGGAHGLRMEILFDLLPLATHVLLVLNSIALHVYALCLAWTRLVICGLNLNLVCNVMNYVGL